MKKRKLLSILLSLALVFSMTSAFAVSSYAVEEEPLGSYTPDTPNTVTVGGERLSVGKYCYYNEGTLITSNEKPNEGGYAYYKQVEGSNAVLVLHDFDLTVPDTGDDVNNGYGITVTSDEQSFNALFIELEGENSITMGTAEESESKNENPAIYAALNLTISSDCDGTLSITTNEPSGESADGKGYGIYANNFELLSGNLEITSGRDGIYAEYDNVTISGGSLKITAGVNSAYQNLNCSGIYAGDSVIINAGKVEITSANNYRRINTGIYAYFGSVVINGGELSISSVGYAGIKAYASVIIKNGYVEIDKTGNYGIFSDHATVRGGQIVIKDVLHGIYIGDVHDETQETNADVTISGGKVEIYNVVNEGIMVYDGDVTISGGQVKITDVGREGIDAWEGIVNITNSAVSIKSELCGIDSENDIIIKNSDVEVCTVSEYGSIKAFRPSVTVEGNPVVYAGSTSETAVQVTDLSNLAKYQYVHIHKDDPQDEESSFFNSIANAFNSLFAWFAGVKMGTLFSNSFIGKLLAAFCQWGRF